tara:strand:+ start:73 stop:297 length:225 start_codon:yes stop_codon:yes gene_type:complete
MRNKPLPGMMKHSPMKENNHPVTPPTKEQAKRSKGTLKTGSMLAHGRFDRPGVFSETKRIFGEKYNTFKKKLGY